MERASIGEGVYIFLRVVEEVKCGVACRSAEPCGFVHIPLLGPDLVVRGARHQDNDPYAARAANRDVLIEMQAMLLIDGPRNLNSSQICAHDVPLPRSS